MSSVSRRRLGFGKRLLFSFALGVLAYAAIELLAWASHPLLCGRPFAWAQPIVDVGDVAAPVAEPAAAAREAAAIAPADPTLCLHPYLGYVFTPEHGSEVFAERTVLGISEDGFLDDRGPVRKRSPGKLIVGLLGGSVAGMLATYGTDELARRLRDHAELRDHEIEFVRLALPGYHQPQQLFALGWVLALGGELDVVINLDGFNEIAVAEVLNDPVGIASLFPMNWARICRDTGDPTLRRHLGALAYLRAERRSAAERFSQSILSWSVTATTLWALGDARLERAIADRAAALSERDTAELPYFVRGPRRAPLDPEDHLVELVEVWRRCSLQMQALCTAHGVRYFHFLQPNQYVPGSKPLSTEELSRAHDEGSPYRPVAERGYPLLRRVGAELRAAGVWFVDLTEVFAGVGETLYIDTCCHFNAKGNALVSKAIARAVHESY